MKKITDINKVIEVGKKIGINWETVKFSPEDLLDGINVEYEHGFHDPQTNVTNDDLVATAKIALAHLKESPDYYRLLKDMERKLMTVEEAWNVILHRR